MNVRIKLMIGASSLALALMMGCGGDTSNGNATNSNSTTNTMNTNARSSVDEMPATTTPEYETTTNEAGGVKTETRTYRDKSRIDRVVITTRDGKRTAKAYSASGEEKELRTDDLDDVLAKGGNAIADAAGFVADKAKDAGKAVVDKGGTVVSKVGEGAKTVGEKTAEGAKTVGEKTAEGAKTVGKKTVQGAKKVGGAVKDAVTP
jgi:hypothetical protein